MRGIPSTTGVATAHRRISPAHAGNTLLGPGLIPDPEDQPRTCGEYDYYNTDCQPRTCGEYGDLRAWAERERGSAPHMRGILR